jgi:hypothetical protein
VQVPKLRFPPESGLSRPGRRESASHGRLSWRPLPFEISRMYKLLRVWARIIDLALSTYNSRSELWLVYIRASIHFAVIIVSLTGHFARQERGPPRIVAFEARIEYCSQVSLSSCREQPAPVTKSRPRQHVLRCPLANSDALRFLDCDKEERALKPQQSQSPRRNDSPSRQCDQSLQAPISVCSLVAGVQVSNLHDITQQKIQVRIEHDLRGVSVAALTL